MKISTQNTLGLWVLGLLLSSCASSFTRTRDITFDPVNQLKLDVYSPKNIDQPKAVCIFVHGGRWNSGRKSQYKFFGKRLASKGVVAVIPDYRLSPRTTYRGATSDVAMAIKWTKENINNYGGRENEIFIAGHSAGGHLAALVSTDSSYFDSLKLHNPIWGTLLIDAFGLDMYTFLSDSSFKKHKTYYAMFGNDPEKWKNGSPIFHLRDGLAPFLIFVGSKTYPVIVESNNTFMKALMKYQPATKPIIVMKKKHIPMMLQFYKSRNKGYQEIVNFITVQAL